MKQDCDDVRIPKSYAPDKLLKQFKMKLNESTNINPSSTVSDERCINITLSPKTNDLNSLNIQPFRDESSHPVPIMNSKENLTDQKSVCFTESSTSSLHAP